MVLLLCWGSCFDFPLAWAWFGCFFFGTNKNGHGSCFLHVERYRQNGPSDLFLSLRHVPLRQRKVVLAFEEFGISTKGFSQQTPPPYANTEQSHQKPQTNTHKKHCINMMMDAWLPVAVSWSDRDSYPMWVFDCQMELKTQSPLPFITFEFSPFHGNLKLGAAAAFLECFFFVWWGKSTPECVFWNPSPTRRYIQSSKPLSSSNCKGLK